MVAMILAVSNIAPVIAMLWYILIQGKNYDSLKFRDGNTNPKIPNPQKNYGPESEDCGFGLLFFYELVLICLAVLQFVKWNSRRITYFLDKS